jgi:hypothetical protein
MKALLEIKVNVEKFNSLSMRFLQTLKIPKRRQEELPENEDSQAIYAMIVVAVKWFGMELV